MQISGLKAHPSYFRRMADSLLDTGQCKFNFDWHLCKGITSTKPSVDGSHKVITTTHLNISVDNTGWMQSVRKERQSQARKINSEMFIRIATQHSCFPQIFIVLPDHTCNQHLTEMYTIRGAYNIRVTYYQAIQCVRPLQSPKFSKFVQLRGEKKHDLVRIQYQESKIYLLKERKILPERDTRSLEWFAKDADFSRDFYTVKLQSEAGLMWENTGTHKVSMRWERTMSNQ